MAKEYIHDDDRVRLLGYNYKYLFHFNIAYSISYHGIFCNHNRTQRNERI